MDDNRTTPTHTGSIRTRLMTSYILIALWPVAAITVILAISSPQGQSAVLAVSIGVAVAAAVVALIVSLAAAYNIAAPLTDLAESVSQIAAGHLELRLEGVWPLRLGSNTELAGYRSAVTPQCVASLWDCTQWVGARLARREAAEARWASVPECHRRASRFSQGNSAGSPIF
jgi:hypothetical protein